MLRAIASLWLVAIVAPPEPGWEAHGNVGGGHYHTLGCATGVSTQYTETSWAGGVRHRGENGLTVAVDTGGARGIKTSGPEADHHAFSATGRVGWHGDHFGIEGGAGYLRQAREDHLVPSALIWAGAPEVHLFGTLLADRYAVHQPDLILGVGHKSRKIAASLGLSPVGGLLGLTAELELRLSPLISPMISVKTTPSNDNIWNVAGGVVVRWDPQLQLR